MEILAIDFRHARWVAMLGRMIEDLSDELQIPRRSCGRATLRRNDLEIAIEPDRAYYFTNEAKVRGKFELDFERDPPPDLVIEIETTNSTQNRLAIHGQLGVPEVWLFDGSNLFIMSRAKKGQYASVERSVILPMMPIPEFVRFMQMSTQIDDTTLSIAFRNWIRNAAATEWREQLKSEVQAGIEQMRRGEDVPADPIALMVEVDRELEKEG
jgi:hypothetical protein